MEVARLVLEYLKLLMSPQAVAAAVAIFIVLRFRTAIDAKLRGLSSVRAPGGIEASFEAQEAAAAESKKVLEQATAKGSPQRELIAPAVAPEHAKALETLARWWVFEKIYRAIFRSQIELLRHLQRQTNHSDRWTNLMGFYQTSGIVPTEYPYSNYMTFLKNYDLIRWRLEPGGSDATVFLTENGAAFLEYLVMQNYNIMERPF